MKNMQPRLVDQRVRYSLIRQALPPAPARICELGVGGGWLLHCLHDEGYDVYGCDVSLKDFPQASPLAGRIHETSGTKLPFVDNYFDATYSCDVLEHVFPDQRDAFLKELIRVTKPGGVVALTAFFNNTLSFRIFGVMQLLFRGTLPVWYTEHLTIPLPSEKNTYQKLSESLDCVSMVRYQRALGMLIMWLQSVGPFQRRLGSVYDLPRDLIPTCDVLGTNTSTFFTGRKLK